MAAAVGLTLLLRVPWLGAPLGNDEGGLTYIAEHWHHGGPDLYGHYFIDRPPLLLGVFRIAAETGGAVAVRAIGAIAAAALVLVVALLGRELGGKRSGIWAGAIAAVLGSSALLGSVFTPAELLAVLPSAASVLLLLISRRSVRREHLLLLLAGLLAAAALLVKQSFGDALVAGAAFLLVGAYLDRGNRRRWAGLAAAYCGGIALALAGLEAWAILGGVPDDATGYALIGFRLQGLSALSGSAGGLPARFADRLALPLLGSGLALILIWSLVGLHRLREQRALQLTIAAWGAAGAAGVLLGGSYWSHYLIELIPMAAATAALALPAGGRLSRGSPRSRSSRSQSAGRSSGPTAAMRADRLRLRWRSGGRSRHAPITATRSTCATRRPTSPTTADCVIPIRTTGASCCARFPAPSTACERCCARRHARPGSSPGRRTPPMASTATAPPSA